MRPQGRFSVAGALGGWLLSLLLVPLAWPRLTAPAVPTVPLQVRRQPHRTPAEEALWRARWDWTQAQLAVNREREALLDWDPAAEVVDDELWRRQLMARHSHGHLRQARWHTRQAEALARTPREMLQVVRLRAFLECAAGDHREELRQARRLTSLAPQDPTSQRVLRRAVRCHSGSQLR